MKTFARRVFVCSTCNNRDVVWCWNTEPPPICPDCYHEMAPEPVTTNLAPGVITDSIPGGLDVPHAICWPDGTPRRFYSKSEIRDTAREAGWTMGDETPLPPRRGYPDEQ